MRIQNTKERRRRRKQRKKKNFIFVNLLPTKILFDCCFRANKFGFSFFFFYDDDFFHKQFL